MQPKTIPPEFPVARPPVVSRSESDPPIRADLYGSEQLCELARACAAATDAKQRSRSSPLLRRLRDNDRVVHKTHKEILQAARNGEKLSLDAEWLLDNFYIVEQVLLEVKKDLPSGYYRELPALDRGAFADHPRIYELAFHLVAHVDGALDEGLILELIRAYQTVSPLTIGELWAVPTVLRLVLLENLRRLATQMLETRRDRDAAESWAERATVSPDWPDLPDVARDAFFVALQQALRDREVAPDTLPAWMAPHCQFASDALQREHHRQAANQVTIGNCVTSLRLLNVFDWTKFFENASLADEALRTDKAGIYARQDFATRDRYRKAVEQLARGSKISELAIAKAAVERGAQAMEPKQRHVGWWLFGEGRRAFEQEIGFRPSLRYRVTRSVIDHPNAVFFGTLTAIAAAFIWLALTGTGVSTPAMLAFAVILLLLPAIEIAVSLTNYLVCRFVPPRVLPKLDFAEKISDDSATFVVVPCMLTSPDSVTHLIERLELHYLANPDPRLWFALLTDFADAPTEKMRNDDALIQATTLAIGSLNQRYADAGPVRFFLFHRRRQWNESQNCWMGWERKRGKLEEFFQLLRGVETTSFDVRTGDPSALPRVQYVLTLDADTVLPRDAAGELIGTLAHPLNRAAISPDGRRVTSGYAILQPRVTFRHRTALRSPFAGVFAPSSGFDPYSRAVSDVYQDLFCKGTFTGKGLIDIDAFMATAGRAFPENHILSHDLIESTVATCGLASDIEVFDDFPAKYPAFAGREHRWVRGDWQLLPWLRSKVPFPGTKGMPNVLTFVERWKITDNLRRSLSPIALVVLLAAGWLVLPGAAWKWTLLALAASFVPLMLHALDLAIGLIGGVPSRAVFRQVETTFVATASQCALMVAFALHRATLMIDAIVRTLYRMLVSRRQMLQWETAADVEKRIGNDFPTYFRLMGFASLLSVGIWMSIAILAPTSMLSASPVLFVWTLAPLIAFRISQPSPSRVRNLDEPQIRAVRRTARKTWHFFEQFMGPQDHWLPPDNFQEDPKGAIAHRTSPTNSGLMLLSTLAAHDLGYVTLPDLIGRLHSSFRTFDSLERYRGHFFNWYETDSLKVLQPAYVSTVDSGNLLGCFWTLAEGLREKMIEGVPSPSAFEGLRDTVGLLVEALVPYASETSKDARNSEAVSARVVDLNELVREAPIGLADYRLRFQRAAKCADALLADLAGSSVAGPTADTAKRWADRLATLAGGRIAELEVDSDVAANWVRQLSELAAWSERLASEMDFRFLYNPQRHLFAVGFNASNGRLDSSHYDLLASEACLASFLTIARGEIPRKHWFHLGRLSTQVAGHSGLISWGGSMFEFLMPRLLLPIAPETLLDSSHRAAVARQIEYGAEKGVPWGISESGFYYLDAGRDYQYQSFGVPGLGLKQDLAADLVIAPYASMLAAMIDPHAAVRNFAKLRLAGAEGPFGFYEALDYTPSRIAKNQPCQIVKSYMAHHQGMGLLALANLLTENAMPRRLRARAAVRSVELLLEERIPFDAPLMETWAEEAPNLQMFDGRMEVSRRITNPDTPGPRTHLLSNGRYSVMLTNSGAGYSRCDGLDVTRWRADRTADAWGQFVYLRDHSDGSIWSAGHQPMRKRPDSYEAIYSIDKAEFRRFDGDLETVMEVTVAPDKNVEVRRVTVRNHGARMRRIDMTSYAEVALAAHGADVAHPAFGKLFLETEFVPASHALLCRRRPRDKEQKPIWAVHVVAIDSPSDKQTTYETDREKFLGRRRSSADPQAIEIDAAELTGSEGPVLDPIFCLRRHLWLWPGGSSTVSFSTGVAESREDALALADLYHSPHAVAHAFELAWAHCRVELRHPGLSVDDAHLFQRLAGHVLFPTPGLRAKPEILAANRMGQSGLWRMGISGDLPIVLVRISETKETPLLEQLLGAHSFWRLKGLTVDLVVLNEESGGYFEEVQQRILSIVRSSNSNDLMDRPGGVFVRKSSQLSEDDRNLLLSAARVVLSGDRGALGNQVDVVEWTKSSSYRMRRRREEAKLEPKAVPQTRFDNGIGGFSVDGREYAIRGGAVPPAPWINVIANANFGFLVSDSGGGFTWAKNSQTNRLTPWSNDPVADPSGEVVYLRDEVSDEVWSTTPLPIRDRFSMEVRHGHGYTTFEQVRDSLQLSTTMFVPGDDPVKIWLLRMENRSAKARQLSATFYAEWVLGVEREQTSSYIVTEVDEETGAVFARNAFNMDFGSAVTFVDVSRRPRTFTGDRAEFLGRNRTLDLPSALERPELSGHGGAGLDPCTAIQTKFTLAPGEKSTLVFVLGQTDDVVTARRLVARYRQPDEAEAALQAVIGQWNGILGTIQIETPDEAMNLLVNRWLVYQVAACRLWARSAFYQSGGAFGFRDQLQDVMALVHCLPNETRGHILRAARRQFPEGDVQHWWHPPAGRGVRTRFSDDFLWLVYVVCHYVTTTGDCDILDEQLTFLRAATLNPDQEEVYSQPIVGDETASLYEHCIRALDNGWKLGEHGLPLMGTGDWNDGMNKVGNLGKGESVWVAWFQMTCLDRFAEICDSRHESARANDFRERAKLLLQAVETKAWDGQWYRRAYFDDGTPLGSSANQECQIDSIAQTWAIISERADPPRARSAMRSLEHRLIKRDDRLILLFDPPFDAGTLEPGYIKGYVPGIRENGGQYTHAAIWVVQATALQGRGNDAHQLFDLLNPIRRAETAELAARYRVEPYVLAADVYGCPQHMGRGGWTWYTGSASVLYRVALENILGFQRHGNHLHLNPCIPKHWPKFQIRYRYENSDYTIVVENPKGVESGVERVWLDGEEIKDALVPLAADGRSHGVRVLMGAVNAEIKHNAEIKSRSSVESIESTVVQPI